MPSLLLCGIKWATSPVWYCCSISRFMLRCYNEAVFAVLQVSHRRHCESSRISQPVSHCQVSVQVHFDTFCPCIHPLVFVVVLEYTTKQTISLCLLSDGVRCWAFEARKCPRRCSSVLWRKRFLSGPERSSLTTAVLRVASWVRRLMPLNHTSDWLVRFSLCDCTDGYFCD